MVSQSFVKKFAVILNVVIMRILCEYFRLKKQLNRAASLMAHRMLCRAMSAVVTFHNM